MSEADNVLLPAKFPKDWPISTVGAQFHIILGKMLDAEKNVGRPKPYVGNRSVQWGQIDVSELDMIKLTEADIRKYRLLGGDLLVCEGGDIGRAAIWQDQLEECYFQKAIHRLRPRGTYSSVLMRYLLEYYANTGFLINFATQTSIAHLPKDKFVTVPLPLPSPHEQQTIAAALSDADGVVVGLERVIAKRRLIKQGAMQDLLTARRRLPGFSAEWDVAALGSVLRRSPSYGINAPALPRGSGGYAYLRITDIANDGTVDASVLPSVRESASDEYLLTAGDIVVARTGASVGKSHLFRDLGEPVIFAGFLIRLCPDDTKISPSFLSQYMRTDQYWCWIRENSARSGQPGINSQQLRTIMLKLPKIEEQQAIATVLSDMDAELQTLESRLAKARAIKEGMMQELLTGRVRLV